MIGNPVVNAGVLLSLVDRMTPKMRQVLMQNKNAFKTMGGQWDSAKISQYDRHMKSIANSQRLMMAGGAMFGSGLMGAITTTNSFAKFESDTKYYQTLLDQITEKNIRWQREVLKLAGTTGAGIADINKGIYQSLSSGIPEEKILSFMDSVTEASIGGRTSVEDTVNTVTTIMNAYKIPAEQTDSILGKLFVTVKKGKIEFSQLNSTIADFASTGSLGKLSIDELLGSVSALTQGAGIAPAEAGTAINRFIMSVISAQDESKKFAESIGLDFDIAYLQKVGLVPFLNEIMEKTGGSIVAIQKLFPEIRAFKMVAPLVDSANEKFNQYVEDIKSGSGEAQKAYKIMSDSTAQEMERMKQNWESFKIVVGEGFAPTANKVLENFNDTMMEWIDSGKAEKIGQGAINGAMGAGALTVGLGAANWFTKMRSLSSMAYSSGLAGEAFTRGGNVQYLAHSLGNALATAQAKAAAGSASAAMQAKILGATASVGSGIAQLIPVVATAGGILLAVKGLASYWDRKSGEARLERLEEIDKLREKYEAETDPVRKNRYAELINFKMVDLAKRADKDIASLLMTIGTMDFNPYTMTKQEKAYMKKSEYISMAEQADWYIENADQEYVAAMESVYRELLFQYADQNEEMAKVLFGYLLSGNDLVTQHVNDLLHGKNISTNKTIADQYAGPDKFLTSRNIFQHDKNASKSLENFEVYVTINQKGDRVESVDARIQRNDRLYEKKKRMQYITNPSYDLVPK